MRQMATLISASVPILQSLTIVGTSAKNRTLFDLIQKIKIFIENGYTLSESISLYPRYFNPLCCGLVSAGELSGKLEEMFQKIADYQEKAETLKNTIQKAFFYPIVVTIIALCVSMILLVYVVPQFEVLFKNFGAELPFLTQCIIRLSNIIQKHGWIIVLCMVMLISMIRYAHQCSIPFQEKMDHWVLRLPIFGPILEKAIIARFASTLAITFGAGVPLIEALEASAQVTHNTVYIKAIQKVKYSVSQGITLKKSLEDVQLFPNMVIQMIAVGEQSGSLESLLAKISQVYEEEVNFSISTLSRLVEPMLMVTLGVLVGGLIIALYLPIFSMGQIV